MPHQTPDCPDCNKGILKTKYLDDETTGGKGEVLIVRNVPHLVCNSCGATLLSAVSCAIIGATRRLHGVESKRPKRL